MNSIQNNLAEYNQYSMKSSLVDGMRIVWSEKPSYSKDQTEIEMV